MSKRKTTTALPTVNKNAGRQFKSRSDREAEVNRLVIIFSIVLTILIVVILGIAIFVEAVVAPNQAVAAVGGQTITVRDYQNRVRYERYETGIELAPIANSQFAQQFLTNDQFGPYAEMYRNLQIPTSMGQSVLNQLIDEAIIAQYARENNITVSEAEVDEQIFEAFGYDPTFSTATPTTAPSQTPTPIISPTPSPSPTPTEMPSVTPTLSPTPFPTGVPTATPGPTEQAETFQENKQQYEDAARQAAGADQAIIRQVFAARALREKVIEAVLGAPPKEQEQVKARHILLKSKEEADQVLASLQAGEDFGALAAALSQDPGSKERGGELDWAGRGVYVPQFEDAVFSAQIGDIIGPIDTSSNGPNFGFHIIQVQAREMRPLTDAEGLQERERLFTKWLEEQRNLRSAQTFPLWIEVTPSNPTLAELGLPESVQ